jgi:uncharacterized protein (TIGR02145 family)
MRNKIYFIVIFSFVSLISNAQTIIDIDGNSYNSVVIGAQTWMQENLKTTRFNNGIEIPTTSLPINNDTTILYQWPYDQDTNNINIYGRLYTWNVAYSNDNVCPNSWHVPDNSDWETLRDFLGGESIAGGKMKEIGTTHWLETNSTVDNSSGFTGLGSGTRGNPSGFYDLDQSASFWSSTPFGMIGNFPRGNVFTLAAANNMLTNSVAMANNGKAIRCIKDVTTRVENSYFKNKIQLYPNPATDRVIISFEEIRNYHLSIYNLLGNTVYQKKIVNKVNHIDIAFLPKGTYLIQVVAEDYVVPFRLIKQ